MNDQELKTVQEFKEAFERLREELDRVLNAFEYEHIIRRKGPDKN